MAPFLFRERTGSRTSKCVVCGGLKASTMFYFSFYVSFLDEVLKWTLRSPRWNMEASGIPKFFCFFVFFLFFANSSISANYCLVRWQERNWLHRLVRGNGRHVSHSRFHFVVEWSVFDDLSLWTALITQGSDRGSGGRDSNISTKSETDHIE